MKDIPVGWHKVSLDRVAYIQTGIAKGGKLPKRPVELPYLRVANVQDGHLDLSEIKTIEIEQAQIDRYLLKPGDVLLTEGGDFDKLGRGTVWRGEISQCLHQNHVFAVRLNQGTLLPKFFAAQVGSSYGKSYFLSCAKRSTNLASINKTQLSEFPVLLPPLAEQRKIAAILGTWDAAIATAERLVAALRARKQALMQRLLTGEVRFPGFEGEWGRAQLGQIFSERRESGRIDLPLLSITNKQGVIPREMVERRDTSNEDKTKYLHICKGDLGYNTMRMWQGVSAVSHFEGVVSPAYTICKPADNVDVNFIGYLFKYEPMIHLFWRYSQGLVDDTLSLKFNVFAKIPILLPSLQEQKRIAQVLRACDEKIAQQEREVQLLRQQKRGLMQQLLTGEVRVTGDE